MLYLNNAATSWPKPKEVYQAVSKNFDIPPCNSARSGIDKESDDIIFSTRQQIADLFNIDNPVQVIFTSGSTEALNMAIKGIELEGQHVVSTEIEHNSVIRPLMTLKEEGHIELDFAPCDNAGYVSAEAIEKAMKPNTKAVVVNHCSNVTGTYLDLKAISEVAHKNGAYFIVDASQSSGYIPIDVKEMDIDFLAFTGHKSLYGLPGIGGLWFKDDIKIKPLKTGGTGIKSEVLTQPSEMPLFCEAGTPNTPGIISINAGIKWINEVGMDKIREHKKRSWLRIYNALKDIPEVKVYFSQTNNSYANFCFNIDKMVPEEINYILESSYEIHVRSGLHCAPLILKALGVHPWGTVRASASYFTTDEELDRFIDAIKEIVVEFPRRKK